jgi:hypothetical protein
MRPCCRVAGNELDQRRQDLSNSEGYSLRSVSGFDRAGEDNLYSRTPGGSINIIVPFLITKVLPGIAPFSGSVSTLASFVVFSEGMSGDAKEGHEGFAVEGLGWLPGDIAGPRLGNFMTLLAWTVILTSREAIFGII